MNKQKTLLIGTLSLSFLLVASSAFAALTFNSNAITTDDTISFSGGNVGIGTDSPQTPLDVEYTAVPFADDLAYGNQTLKLTVDSSNTHPLGSLQAFAPSIDMQGTANVNSALVSAFAFDHHGTGTVSQAFNIIASGINASTGTITNFYDLAINEVDNSGGGTITNQYGIDISDLTTATHNFAIKTGLGKVDLGDTLTVGPAESTLSSHLQDYTGGGQVFVKHSGTGNAIAVEASNSSGTVQGLYATALGTNSYGVDGESFENTNGGTGIGVYSYAQAVDSATNTILIDLAAGGLGIFPGSSVDYAYGLKIADIAGATHNYGIKIDQMTGGSTIDNAINYADKFYVDAGGNTTATTMQLTPTTVSGLPTCDSTQKGRLAFVTDSNTVTWGATVAGGNTNNVGVGCNGSVWNVFFR